MTDTIEELERLLGAATEGPWSKEVNFYSNGATVIFGPKPVQVLISENTQFVTDAALIVALRNAAPSLIAKLKAVTAERDAMAEALTKIANHPLNLSRGEPNDARQAEWESGEDYGTRRAAQVARKALESSQ